LLEDEAAADDPLNIGQQADLYGRSVITAKGQNGFRNFVIVKMGEVALLRRLHEVAACEEADSSLCLMSGSADTDSSPAIRYRNASGLRMCVLRRARASSPHSRRDLRDSTRTLAQSDLTILDDHKVPEPF